MIFYGISNFPPKCNKLLRNLFPESKKEVQKFLWSKMPRNTVIDPNRVDGLVLGGGLKQDTLKRRERAYKALDDFLRAQYKVTADDALKSSQLEDVLMSYFESLRGAKLRLKSMLLQGWPLTGHMAPRCHTLASAIHP